MSTRILISGLLAVLAGTAATVCTASGQCAVCESCKGLSGKVLGEVVDSTVGAAVKLVRALPCHARGRGFESRRPRHSFQALAESLASGVGTKRNNKQNQFPPPPSAA